MDTKEEDGIDFSALWGVFKRRWYIVVLFGILVGFITGAVASLRYVPKYSASVSFLISTDSNFSSQYQNTTINDSIVHTYEVAFKHNKEFCQFLTEYAQTEETLGYTASDVASMMRCEQILDNTPTLQITFTCPHPTAAYNLAESLRLFANDELEGRFKTLSAVDVFNEPELPTSPVTRDPFVKMAVIGFLIGGLLIYMIFVILAITDKTVHGELSLESFSDYPLLGVVPTITGKRSGKGVKSANAPNLK